MNSATLVLLCISTLPSQNDKATKLESFLARPAYCEDHELRGPSTPYEPQPGDIMFSADNSKFWLMMHRLAGTDHPTHSMVAFRRTDGTMAILEAGPHDTLRCRTMDAIPHLRSYEVEGRVWVRRRTVPLTEEQSCKLTKFAMQADGKQFAICRLGQQLTPLRMRGPIRTYFVGRPRGEFRLGYYCAELVMESLVAAEALDAKTTRPSATYPRDIMMDASPNHYLNKHLKLAPCWDPPARWTSCPIEVKE